MTKVRGVAEDERYDVLRKMLEDLRGEIQEKLRSLRASPSPQQAEVRDPEEQSVQDFVQDVELALMQMTSETLGKIDDAIHRLERGEYGTCAECARDIPAARLTALPFALLCVPCQEQEEERTSSEPRRTFRTALDLFPEVAAVRGTE